MIKKFQIYNFQLIYKINIIGTHKMDNLIYYYYKKMEKFSIIILLIKLKNIQI
jgi:hypothetical protein